MFVAQDVVKKMPLTIKTINGAYYQSYLFNSGSNDMIVDGSVSPVEFAVTSSSDLDFLVKELNITLTATSLNLGEGVFTKADILLNGFLVQIVQDNNIEQIQLSSNDDFFTWGKKFAEFTGNNDIVTLTYNFYDSVVLRKNSSDKISLTVRDDITATDALYFKANVRGVKI